MKLFNAFTKYRSYLLIALVSLGALGLSFGSGYLVGGRNEVRLQIKEVEKRIYVPVKEIQEVQVRNVQREQQLQEQLETTRLAAQSLRSQLANRPVDGTCPTLDPVNVGLLNEAITNGAPSDPASVAPDQGQTAAVRDLELWAADAAAQYNELATRHNGLVDWVQEELIEPQRTGD